MNTEDAYRPTNLERSIVGIISLCYIKYAPCHTPSISNILPDLTFTSQTGLSSESFGQNFKNVHNKLQEKCITGELRIF